jgi:hypothetical protein
LDPEITFYIELNSDPSINASSDPTSMIEAPNTPSRLENIAVEPTVGLEKTEVDIS